MLKIEIKDDFITLSQFLKISSLISTGGESKNFIIENNVNLNGKRIFERNKKIYKNDIVEINNKKYQII
ncbi:RNA-binding S4 domain-containing protein [[Mycoplasma] mobile]|uniref:Expressed protein n=1 Tax=Mycoplasma mobile (strain ATCC 43663 / 163K / NCTC 11711) TaxID=267748 RepID=Q6KIT5_MYCM1|nr:RNA-binding S4 domain-containing protein [[Mycoplasma] mobile]AAT27489.1 expressed protein [Mycoplasma mobile 163K]